jgi:hypothetical protein
VTTSRTRAVPAPVTPTRRTPVGAGSLSTTTMPCRRSEARSAALMSDELCAIRARCHSAERWAGDPAGLRRRCRGSETNERRAVTFRADPSPSAVPAQTPQQPSQRPRSSRLRPSPLVMRGEPAGSALLQRTRGVCVASSPRIALRHHQDVLAERRQQLPAERAAVRRRLEAPCGPDRPPARRHEPHPRRAGRFSVSRDGTPSCSSFWRSIAALSSAPNSSATLVSQIHATSRIAPVNAP